MIANLKISFSKLCLHLHPWWNQDYISFHKAKNLFFTTILNTILFIKFIVKMCFLISTSSPSYTSVLLLSFAFSLSQFLEQCFPFICHQLLFTQILSIHSLFIHWFFIYCLYNFGLFVSISYLLSSAYLILPGTNLPHIHTILFHVCTPILFFPVQSLLCSLYLLKSYNLVYNII